MGLGSIPGPMVGFISANMNRTKSMDSGFTIGLMAVSIKEIGSMENNMVSVYISMVNKVEPSNLVSGKMENVSCGSTKRRHKTYWTIRKTTVHYLRKKKIKNSHCK